MASRVNAFCSQSVNVGRLGAGGRNSAFVFAFALRPNDALALALQHDLALELGDGADHVQHEPAGRRCRVEVHGEDAQRCALALDPLDDSAEVRDRTSQTAARQSG